MNHKNTTLAIAAIVAAVAMTGIAFAIPQQALAYGHHHNHNHNNHGNSIKVNQDVTQVNQCANSSWCYNTGDNTADIHR
jgi:hypothetical protein